MTELESYIAAIRAIADATKRPFHSKAQKVAHNLATEALKQWGGKV